MRQLFYVLIIVLYGLGENVLAEENMRVRIIHQVKSHEAEDGLQSLFYDNSEPISILNNPQQNRDDVLFEISEREIMVVMKVMELYLGKKKINVVQDNGDLTIRLVTDVLSVDSIKGYTFNAVEYEAVKNDQIVFNGSFSQRENCPKATSLIQGGCKSKDIGRILAKDIIKKIDGLRNSRHTP